MVNVSKIFSMINQVKVAKVGKTASNMAEQAVQKMDKGAIVDDVYKTVVNPDGSMSKLFSNGNRVVKCEKNGITARKVYNQYGELVLEDTKKLTTEQVGNKTVRTKEINREVSAIDYRTDLSSIGREHRAIAFYYKADRVYLDHKLVGMRETENCFGDRITRKLHPDLPKVTHVTKSVPVPNRTITYLPNGADREIDSGIPAMKGFVKTFERSGKDKRVVEKCDKLDVNWMHRGKRDYGVGAYKPIRNMGLSSDLPDLHGYGVGTGYGYDTRWQRLFYNKRGLPMPQKLDWNKGVYAKYSEEDFADMSLKEMRELAEKYQKYGWDGLGLEHLNIPYKERMG